MAADFRGYLQSVAPNLLGYVGNDGGVNVAKASQGFSTGANKVGGGSLYGFSDVNALKDKVSNLYGTYLSSQQPNPAANNQLTALQQQIASLQSQQAYQPKLPTFDVLGNYTKARSTAESAVNPRYNQLLNDFLAQNQVKQENKRQEVGLTKSANAVDLASTVEGNSVNRARTFEDTTNSIADINAKEGQMQQDTGTAFDVTRRNQAEADAAAGLTGTGVAAGRMFDADTARNIDEGRQVAEANNQRVAKQLFQSRTIDDLAKGDNDAKAVAANKDAAADFDLESYLEELSGDETNFRNTNETQRLADIAGQTGTYAQQGAQSFLSSLAGSGYRPQDIALAYQVYG